MNFIEEFKKGQSGINKGLPMGDGLANISNIINGIQRNRLYGIGSAPKTGKTTFVDYGFVIQPYLYAISNNINIEWIYYSFEIDRVSKEFDFITYFLHHDYKIFKIKLEDGITKDGKSIIELSPDYLRGRIIDDNGNHIKINKNIYNFIKITYNNRIIPIFGEYNKKGILVKKGLITFIEKKDNPTGIYKYLISHASKNGTFITNNNDKYKRIIGFNPKDSNKYTIVVVDHIRKLILERGWQIKQTVDKLIGYEIDIKNWTGYTFVNVVHTNRTLSSQDKIRFAQDHLYPTSDSIKDTGNLSEDCDYMFTMMNPNDDRYKLNNHFGIQLKDRDNNIIYPNMRTIHLVESRYCDYPIHFRTNMIGSVKSFEILKLKTKTK